MTRDDQKLWTMKEYAYAAHFRVDYQTVKDWKRKGALDDVIVAKPGRAVRLRPPRDTSGTTSAPTTPRKKSRAA